MTLRLSSRLIAAAAAVCAGSALAATPLQTAAPAPSQSAETAPAPQPTEKEAKALKVCERMTAAQRAQSSKCTDLMKKYNISETTQAPDPLN